MSNFLDRLRTEKDELQDKIDKLTTFMETDSFYAISDNQQYLLEKQLGAMLEYNEILETRIIDLS